MILCEWALWRTPSPGRAHGERRERTSSTVSLNLVSTHSFHVEHIMFKRSILHCMYFAYNNTHGRTRDSPCWRVVAQLCYRLEQQLCCANHEHVVTAAVLMQKSNRLSCSSSCAAAMMKRSVQLEPCTRMHRVHIFRVRLFTFS